MNFASFEYAVLLSGTFFAYWLLSRHSRLRQLVLLAASYLFYAWWNARYLLLIFGSTVLDFFVGKRLHATEQRKKKRWLCVSLAGNLGLLGLFKYYNFFAQNISKLISRFGGAVSPPMLNTALPVGISFFTFQSMSYTIDIYRGQLAPTPDLLSFCVFVAFFPQLVAGPIVRARQFLPQLVKQTALDPVAATRGFFLIAVGLLKKRVVADLLAVGLVDRVFETPQLYTSAELLLGVYGYAAQIYCDFSAYTDIAVGSALLLGLELPENFRLPYRAHNLADFWHRWHVSLSSWLRDYLYIPLGGSRGSAWATYRNLLVTMLLGGLWHGAGWTFIAWGALHGVGLAVTRAVQRASCTARVTASPRRIPVGRLFGVLLTFHLVCLSWVLFRSPNFERAIEILRGISLLVPGTANITPQLWLLLGAGAATHMLPSSTIAIGAKAAHRLPHVLKAALLVAVVLIIRYAGVSDVAPFIYFQF